MAPHLPTLHMRAASPGRRCKGSCHGIQATDHRSPQQADNN
uniref:Uncharacterized protein n=1 Tax=Pseudomonas phage PACT201 TaxID=3230130 RepID=A0AAU8GSP0_9VIRU